MDSSFEDTLARSFRDGAMSAAHDLGISGDGAERAVIGAIVKAAAGGHRIVGDDDEPTWWDRNKSWAIPVAVGGASFLVGADAARNGRSDWGYVHNAGSLLFRRIKKLLGITDDPAWRAVTEASRRPPDWNAELANRANRGN